MKHYRTAKQFNTTPHFIYINGPQDLSHSWLYSHTHTRLQKTAKFNQRYTPFTMITKAAAIEKLKAEQQTENHIETKAAKTKDSVFKHTAQRHNWDIFFVNLKSRRNLSHIIIGHSWKLKLRQKDFQWWIVCFWQTWKKPGLISF